MSRTTPPTTSLPVRNARRPQRPGVRSVGRSARPSLAGCPRRVHSPRQSRWPRSARRRRPPPAAKAVPCSIELPVRSFRGSAGSARPGSPQAHRALHRPAAAGSASARARSGSIHGAPGTAAGARLCDACVLPPTSAAPCRLRPARTSEPRPGGIPPISELKGRPIGRVLTKMGKVSREQVVEAFTFQKSKGGALGRILVDLGYIKEQDLNFALAAQRGYELVSLEGREITKEMVDAVPSQIATTQKVMPIAFDKAAKKLTVAMATHENFRALDDLRTLMGYHVEAVLADTDQIDRLISKHYKAGAGGELADIINELKNDDTLKDLKNRGESIDLDTIKDAADSNPVRKLINLVLLQAIKDKASDIHFEPFESEFKMRYRIDGVLYEMMPPPAHIAVGHQQPRKGHGQSGHRRAARAAGRPHRVERQ